MKKLLILTALVLTTLGAFAQGTAFTYQGRLNDGNNPASGFYDLRFTIYDMASAGAQQGSLLTNAATLVTNGLFTVTLDFGGGIFSGADRWLEIAVRTNGDGDFTNLAPRQQITATPYAIQSVNAATATSATTASNFSGSLSGDVTGTQGVTTVGAVGGVSAANVASGVNVANAAASANTTGAIVKRDGSGNFSAGTITAALSGNATTATTATSFSGSLTGDVTGTQSATVVSTVGGVTAANVASGANLANAATSANTPSTIVKRDASGNISAGTITGNYSGNGAGLTNVNLMTAIPAYAITLTTNSAGGLGFSIDSAPLIGTGPVWATSADVNGDGKVDVVSANYGNGTGNTLSVMTNNGSGKFVLASSPTVGSAPSSVAAADVNGDGKADLISANLGPDTLSVLTNNGSGKFVLASSPTVGSGPRSLVAADVNGDGKVDLISGNSDTNTLSVLTNKGGGIFVLASTPTVGSNPYSVAAADVNGDTIIDLISANSGSNTLSVLFGTGSGSFVLQSSPVVGSPEWVTTADVNGDGKMDLISGLSSSGNNLLVLTNNGGGTFGSNSTFTANSPITAADVNGDGKVDLIGVNANTLSVFTNNGSGGFALAVSPAVGTSPRVAIAADVNGDTNVDLICPNYGDSTMTVWFNTMSTVTTTATLQGNFTGSTLTINGVLTAGSFSGNGVALTNLNAANLAGTIADARLSSNVALLNANETFTGSDKFTGALVATNGNNQFAGSGLNLTNLNASQLASGTVPDARLSSNVAMNNGSENFAGNVTITGFPIVARNILSPTNGATISPTTGYARVTGSGGAVTLSAMTAIANGTTSGAILILSGGNDSSTVTVPDGANTHLSAASHVLGAGDVLILIWDSLDSNWMEISFSNN